MHAYKTQVGLLPALLCRWYHGHLMSMNVDVSSIFNSCIIFQHTYLTASIGGVYYFLSSALAIILIPTYLCMKLIVLESFKELKDLKHCPLCWTPAKGSLVSTQLSPPIILLLASLQVQFSTKRSDLSSNKPKWGMCTPGACLHNGVLVVIQEISWECLRFSQPGFKPRSPSLQEDSLPSEPTGKPNMYVYIYIYIHIYTHTHLTHTHTHLNKHPHSECWLNAGPPVLQDYWKVKGKSAPDSWTALHQLEPSRVLLISNRMLLQGCKASCRLHSEGGGDITGSQNDLKEICFQTLWLPVSSGPSCTSPWVSLHQLCRQKLPGRVASLPPTGDGLSASCVSPQSAELRAAHFPPFKSEPVAWEAKSCP